MRRNGFGVGVITMLLAAGSAVGAQAFVVALPNGYEMIRDKADQPTIVKRSGSKVVPGPITAYAVVRDVVTGQVVPNQKPAEPNAATPPIEQKNITYFVLDTSTGELGVGLSQEEWNQRLQKLGVTSAPTLNPPLLPSTSSGVMATK